MLARIIPKEFDKAIKGLNLLSSVRKDVEERLYGKVDNDRIRMVFDEKIGFQDLDDKEKYEFLKVLHKVIKNPVFDPSILDNINEEASPSVEAGESDAQRMDDMPNLYYDYELKKSFANTYPLNTSRVIMSLFRKTAKFEKDIDRDLCNFDIAMLSEVLKSLKAKTVRSLQNTVSTIERYIEFAQTKNKTFHKKINYATAFDSREKLEGLLDQDAVENMIFNKEEIMAMAMDEDINAQDGVILALLFDGLNHKNEFEELVELTSDQFDGEKLNIREDRVVPVSRETAILIKDALKEERYISVTGDAIRRYKIAEGNHVLRGLRGKTKVKGQIINQRLLRLREKFDYDYLNATSVSYSGQLYLAEKLIREDGFTIDEAIDKVLERFDIPINTSSQFYLRGRIEKYLSI